MKSRLTTATLKVSSFLDEFEKDDIKTKTDIVSLFSSFGVKLERKGKSWIGNCPFHEDSTPSLSVDREKGLYHCFGCGESGDAFNLVMKLKGFTFREALSFLKEGTFPVMELKPQEMQSPKVQRAETKTEEEPEPDRPAFTSVTFDSITEYYQKNLSKSKEAKAYLKSRGLWFPEILKRLKVGFSTGDLKEKLSENQFNELKERGLFTEKGFEAFTGCIVFPLFDPNGHTVSFYGRKINEKQKIKHLYLAGPHKGLFNEKAFKVYPERMIFTESVIDALSLLVLGVQNVSACYGVNGFTPDHLQVLKDSRTKEIVFAFDADEPGKEGAEKLSEQLLTEGFPVRTIYPLPDVKDWNAWLQTGLDRETFDGLVKKSVPREPEGKHLLKVEEKNGRYFFTSGAIQYRIIGVKEGFVSSLKVNIRAEKDDEKVIDNVDLFSARSRSIFSLQLSRALDVEPAKVENDLVLILEWLETERDRKLLGLDDSSEIEMTEAEKALGFEFLKSPELFDRIESDLSALGYVGERMNKLLLYLAASSRKMADPMSVIVISQSAAGKSYLIDTVKKCIPPEDVLSMTSLSDQALNYLPEESLLHKFLIMGEAVHSDVIDHQMREMLSGKELSRLVTVKDEKTGRMESRLVRKKVIVSAVMSSTSNEINPENASRCFVVSTDETEEQTRAIHREQRKKYSLERYERKELSEPEIIKRHHAAQRLLTDRIIVNPFAPYLDFPASLMRSRRDHERFIDLIACVCFLRQFQKEEKEQEGKRFIECDIEDYKIAYDIMMKILPSTLTNFPKSAQLLYERLRKIIEEKTKEEQLQFHEVSITQREIREKEGFEHNFVKRGLRLLVEYEYLEQKGGHSRGGRAFYRISQNAPLTLFDLSSIPEPADIQKWTSQLRSK